MIYLTTGQPGAGKTLWTLSYVKRMAEKENRQVYYNGIPDLKIPGWLELDKPEEWHQLPTGAIIVLDEAQRLFRPRGVGSNVPAYVQALETHRHKGHDLFVITQHPMLIESNLRRLVGKHWHVMRTFGMNRATVHEFTELKQEPDKSREGSIRHEWQYPKEVFGYYKSAEVHTHKRSIPMRVWMLIALPIVLGGLIFTAYTMLDPEKYAQKVADSSEPQAAEAATSPAEHSGPKPDYLASLKPRIESMPMTAPRYDEIQRPAVAPKPVSCVMSASKGCKCYTQQATPLNTPEEVCKQIVQQGWFDDTQPTIYQQKRKAFDPSMPQTQPPAREGGGVSEA